MCMFRPPRPDGGWSAYVERMKQDATYMAQTEQTRDPLADTLNGLMDKIEAHTDARAWEEEPRKAYLAEPGAAERAGIASPTQTERWYAEAEEASRGLQATNDDVKEELAYWARRTKPISSDDDLREAVRRAHEIDDQDGQTPSDIAEMVTLASHIDAYERQRYKTSGLRDDIEEHAASRLMIRGMTGSGYLPLLNGPGWTPGMRQAFVLGVAAEKIAAEEDERNRPVEW